MYDYTWMHANTVTNAHIHTHNYIHRDRHSWVWVLSQKSSLIVEIYTKIYNPHFKAWHKIRDRTYSDHLQMLGMAPIWDIGSPTHLRIFNPKLFLSKGNSGTKIEAETMGSIPCADPKPWWYCWCQEVLAGRNLV